MHPNRYRDCAGPASMTLDDGPGSRPNGIAFGSPVPMIRHRFGGHLRAVRARTCTAVGPRTTIPSHEVLEGTSDLPG
jgi:hypothetical protein